jgi:hypothetical protein
MNCEPTNQLYGRCSFSRKIWIHECMSAQSSSSSLSSSLSFIGRILHGVVKYSFLPVNLNRSLYLHWNKAYYMIVFDWTNSMNDRFVPFLVFVTYHGPEKRLKTCQLESQWHMFYNHVYCWKLMEQSSAFFSLSINTDSQPINNIMH